MFLAYRALNVGAIFPDDDMRKHSVGPTFLNQINSSGQKKGKSKKVKGKS